MITDAQMKSAILEVFRLYGTNGNTMGLSGLVGLAVVKLNNRASYDQVERYISDACVDGWLSSHQYGYGCVVRLVRHDCVVSLVRHGDDESIPSTLRSGAEPITKKEGAVMRNANDYTCHCGRKCNRSEQNCWWCDSPIMSK